MTAYYNEFEPYAAQWLRNLIAAGHIAPGFVDERSIKDVKAEDLKEFTQCHFFAGIGVWSFALRNAGWPDDKPVWTGSCPCQPFSAAGRVKGFNDERHLWPAFYELISKCCPATIFGEQVNTAFTNGWFDQVASDLESSHYACGAASIPACSVGATHKRDRLYFVAYADEGASRRNATTIHAEENKIIRGKESESHRSGFSRPILLRGNDGLERQVPESCFPLLVDGSSVVLAQNSAYGNALHAKAAEIFIRACENTR